MKKLYLLFTFLLIGKFVSAQTYYPMLDSINDWHYVSNWIGVRLQPSAQTAICSYPLQSTSTSFEEFSTNDTALNSVAYKTIETSNGCIAGFLREDTAARKIYFQDNVNSPEILLYDFSMTVGNTMTVLFTNITGYYTTGVYTLDSITTVHIMAGWRRAFHLNNHATPGSPTLTWVESVGNLNDVLYPYFENQSGYGWFNNCPGVEHQFFQFMSCFDHAQKVYFDTCAFQTAINNTNCIMYSDSCDYWNICGAVHELESLASIDIYPNPSNGKTNLLLDVNERDHFEILIWDNTGKKLVRKIIPGTLAPGKTEMELDLGEIPTGFYFLELHGEKGSVYRKLLIEH
jgi:hypothetical protein